MIIVIGPGLRVFFTPKHSEAVNVATLQEALQVVRVAREPFEGFNVCGPLFVVYDEVERHCLDAPLAETITADLVPGVRLAVAVVVAVTVAEGVLVAFRI